MPCRLSTRHPLTHLCIDAILEDLSGRWLHTTTQPRPPLLPAFQGGFVGEVSLGRSCLSPLLPCFPVCRPATDRTDIELPSLPLNRCGFVAHPSVRLIINSRGPRGLAPSGIRALIMPLNRRHQQREWMGNGKDLVDRSVLQRPFWEQLVEVDDSSRSVLPPLFRLSLTGYRDAAVWKRFVPRASLLLIRLKGR
jgi:hypothetical protein